VEVIVDDVVVVVGCVVVVDDVVVVVGCVVVVEEVMVTRVVVVVEDVVVVLDVVVGCVVVVVVDDVVEVVGSVVDVVVVVGGSVVVLVAPHAGMTEWTHWPDPSQVSEVHSSPSSEHGAPASVAQLRVLSSHTFPHSGPPVHGSPAETHEPPLQASTPSQNRPSSQAGSAAAPSITPSQSSSTPLHSSWAPGWTAGSWSLQSAGAAYPSPSASSRKTTSTQ
jgi:hypothetical protein